MFDDLHNAAHAFTICEILTLVFFVFWMEVIWETILGRDFGIPLFNYFVPALTWLAHLAGVIQYFEIANLAMANSCNDEVEDRTEDSIQACGTSGPALIIIELIILTATMIWYYVIYRRRKFAEPNTQQADLQQSLEMQRQNSNASNRD
jgi:hypothetical protein